MKKNLLFLFTSLILVGAYAQDSTAVETKNPTKALEQANFASPKTYTIGGVEVEGDTRYTASRIARFTGLKEGLEIDVPGPRINKAVSKLWKSNLFSDVEIFAKKVVGDKIFLTINIVGRPELLEAKFKGIKKARREAFIKENELKPGIKLTENLINQTKNNIKGYYVEKGYPDAKITHKLEAKDNKSKRKNLIFTIDKGPRVKIRNIDFVGNTELKDSRLKRKGFKNTKRKNLNILQASKFRPELYKDDLKTLIDEYKSVGFRDAKVVDDSVIRVSEDRYDIKVYLDEGKRYFLGDVTFEGNSVFSSDVLQRVFSYKKGDPYDAVGINNKITGSPKDDDINTLYYDRGYIFSRIIPIEKNVKNDTIDLEVKIQEGEPATWNKVTFEGNSVTHDHVVARSLQTRPGDLFSKTAIKATVFDLAGTQYFEPDQIVPDVKPNPTNNTVDINWELAPKSSSQIELQGGYGAGRFIGTLGLTFGNFSIGNLLKGKAWTPVPLGDGQQLSIRAQAGNQFSNYSLTFVEPWIGGKRPTSLSVSFFLSQFQQNDAFGRASNLDIFGTTVGLNKRLTKPDRYFNLNQSIAFRRYNFENYQLSVGDLLYENGASNNLSYNITFSRFNAGPDPIFPKSGSDFALSVDATLPYSLFQDKDYDALRADGNFEEIYKWLEYYKVKARAYWYKELVGKMVLKVGGEFGFLGQYNSDIGIIPFERFYVGGTGLQGNRFDGREIIPLRGYEDASNQGGVGGRDITPEGGGVIYDKFSLELRYPITMGQGAKIYALSFLEAGNVWNDHRDFQPFELKRSAGVGIRIFMAAFGLLGFDFGHGFDPTLFGDGKSGWQTHFIFGQNL